MTRKKAISETEKKKRQSIARSLKKKGRGKESQSDICVFCGCDTGVSKNMPISLRKNYIRGSGQLCEKCYFNLYVLPKEDEHRIAAEKMKTLMELCRKQERGEEK